MRQGIQFQIRLLDNAQTSSTFRIRRAVLIRRRNTGFVGRTTRATTAKAACPMPCASILKAGDGVIFNPYGLHRGWPTMDKPRRTL